ncbi:multicopper oxidase family protein [Streptomyces sp. 4503]|uniref:Multicopper oxidase family protein n=1 Tax=Streptomyces niphimycinicus TaxID=2842201 RepID=A0ABS6CI36_9ACTN|nr:multicopper oxidase family protein [Streptomyces niphimycinicus]MBU3866400.1 multicopper oxidase family protein [Streptomyces niphimycinicus]
MHEKTRRAVLGTGIAAAGSGLLAACGSPGPHPRATGHSGMESNTMGAPARAGAPAEDGPAEYVSPHGPEVAATERRRGPGPVRTFRLTATATTLDIGARKVASWAYEDQVPGQEIRVTAGDTIALTLANNLPQPTTLHWHGIRLRNDMDGVPGVTQRPVRTGAAFDYRFTAYYPGTYWVHPHSGVQLDRGLYAPLIVEDPKEPLKYDKEWVVVLDDWLDGVGGRTPDMELERLGGGKGGHSMGDGSMGDGSMGDAGKRAAKGAAKRAAARPAAPKKAAPAAPMESELLGGHAGDVTYPYYLVNGRSPESPQVFRAKRGDRIRIRLINAGGDTAFRVALGGHRMTVTHTDGYPVVPAKTDALLLGMGERYDVLVTVKDGVFPLAVLAEGKGRSAMAVLRTRGKRPVKFPRPKELDGELLTADRLKAAEDVRLTPKEPDRIIRMRLTGSMRRWDWAINGRPYDPTQRYPVRAGERVRITFINGTDMWHPMHLHGHTFGLPDGGPRKDTTILRPHHKVNVDLDADNPGLWMVHCHNVYHSESGMMTILGYQK